MRTTHDSITELRAERYEQYRLFEEKTDIGERLSLPIENRLTFEVRDGAVYGRTIEGEQRRMTEWAQEAYETALNDPAFSGANAVERLRRRHEYDEAVSVEALRVGEAMLVFSPIPDAARLGTLSLQGYRTDLARTFCRLYYREPQAVTAITLSLEQSNKQALSRVAQQLGMRLPASMQSEAILAARHVAAVPESAFYELPDLIRAHYDLSLYDQTGETFFAGNRLAGSQDSMRFMNDNHDIIDEHMTFLRLIEDRLSPGALRQTELESLRQRTAAALDARLHGGTVSSISDASVSDRMATHDYGGECVTGVQGVQEQMGLAQGTHVTNCPLCGAHGVTATVEGETITCSECRGSVDICSGKVTRREARQKRRSYQAESRKPAKPPARFHSKEAQLSAAYGQRVILKRVKKIGGEDTLVLTVAGEVLGSV